jgi:hypothetical protein
MLIGINATLDSFVRSESLLWRRERPSQPNVRSTIQRFG